MNYTKEMIDLVREVRKRVSANDKPGIKLANPELMYEIQSIYFQSKDSVLRALIRELFIMAGAEWSGLLLDKQKPQARMQTMAYRGQSSLVASSQKKELTEEAATPVSSKSKKIYRGQVVA